MNSDQDSNILRASQLSEIEISVSIFRKEIVKISSQMPYLSIYLLRDSLSTISAQMPDLSVLRSPLSISPELLPFKVRERSKESLFNDKPGSLVIVNSVYTETERYHTLSLNERDLNGILKDIELSLRQLIVRVSPSNPLRFPSEIDREIELRLRKKAARNTTFEFDGTFACKLNHANLSELISLITSKKLWSLFAGYFPNSDRKELIQRAKGFIELRNSDSHIHPFNQLVYLDGFAALVWFRGLINRWRKEY